MAVDAFRPEWQRGNSFSIGRSAAMLTDGLRTLLRTVKVNDQIRSVLIAEGVEREEDLERVEQVGIELAQGYLLDRPNPQWPQNASLAVAYG